MKNSRIPLVIHKTMEDVFEECAKDMISAIRENNLLGEETLIVIPVGPVGQYPIFVKLANEQKVNLKNTYFVLMDAFVIGDKDIPYEHRLSLRRRMDEMLFNLLDEDIKMDENHIIPMKADDVMSANRVIEKVGKIDLCVAGIGINGHIGMNEQLDLPVSEYLAVAKSRILNLSTETRLISAINNYKGALCVMPPRGITLGLKEMMTAKKLYAYCFRDWHNSVIKRACCEAPSGNFPATILQLHQNCKIVAHEKIVEKI